MITKLIIELLEYTVTEYKANEIFIDRTENNDLIIDWPTGYTPHVGEIFADEPETTSPPFRKLASCCRNMTVLAVTPSGEAVRLWIRNGKLELTEKVHGRSGSRMTLFAPLSDPGFIRIQEVCEELAVIHLGARFEIIDEQNACHKEISFEDISKYLEYKLGRIKSPTKMLCGFVDDIKYEFCFTTTWKNGVSVHFHNGEKTDVVFIDHLLSRILDQSPVWCRISVVLVTQGGALETVKEKMEPVLFDPILLYLKNQFSFGIKQQDLGRVLVQRVYDRKMTFVLAENRPWDMSEVADPLWVSINKGMCCSLR